MFGVPAIAIERVDWRLALVAVLAAAATAFMALRAWDRARGRKGAPRFAGLVLAAAIASAGIWAAHVISAGAYVWGEASAYGPLTVALGLFTGALLMLSGLAHRLGRAPLSRGARVLNARRTKWRGMRGRLRVLHKREAELKEQNILLDMALTSLPQGLSMVDADRRLIMCNRRFAEMYSIPDDLTEPGTPIDTLIEHRIAGGMYAAYDADLLRADVRKPLTKTTVKTRHLAGGRVILVTRKPTPNGGWVAIHEDITERRRLQEMEREAKETLAAVFNAVPAAITCLSPDKRVMFWSRGAEHIYGYTAEETVGQPYKLVPPEAKAEFETHFAGAMAGETMRDTSVRRRRKDGTIIDVRFTCAPMRDRDGEVRGIVYASDDITEQERLAVQLKEQHELLKQREEKLKVQNEQLDAALANMVQGLAMFDADERLVLANTRYADLFDAAPDEIKPGVTLREIVRRRVARGLYPGKIVGELMAEFRQRASQGTATHLVYPGNGKIIAAAVKPRVTGGWVVTMTDITEPAELKKQLEARNEQLDVALNNMSQGLAMFDSDQRIVICNRHYAEMYGLTTDDVKPGTTVRQTLESRLKKGLYDDPSVVDEIHARFGQRASDVHQLTDGRTIHVTYRRTASGAHVVTHEDISERESLNARLEAQHQLLKAQEEKLKVQNVQLDAALNNMVQGLAMFDSELHLVVANDRYAELYDLPRDLVKPGTHISALIHQCVAADYLSSRSADEVVQALLDNIPKMEEHQNIIRSKNGRFINVCTKPMSNRYLVTTHQDVTEQRRSEEKIVHMALHDGLTDLPNRVMLNQRLEQALALTKRGGMVAVHLLDLDHFKNVNDTLGHPAGDKLLKAVTARLRGLVRETDVIARMGGDEFAILQPVTQPAEAGLTAHRIIESVSQPYDIDGHLAVIGTSIGIAIGPGDSDVPDQLIRSADLALYRAKDDGRGAFRFFEAGMDAKMRARRAMEHDLRKALVSGEFELFYQPIVNLSSNEISGFEALLRWRHKTCGLILPGAFIPMAEEIGFIIPIGDWVIRQACAAAARWPAPVKVAVNLSPLQFRSSGLVQTVFSALAASGLAPDRLELEITETTLLKDGDAVLSMLYQLRELGVCIAIDDFGTGYSSLSYLQSFPFHRIKIDGSFIKDIADDVGSLNIVRAISALARGLGIETTAEGVETELQRDKVASEGCTEMQGYLFSEPKPAAEIEKTYFPSLQRPEPEQHAPIQDEPAQQPGESPAIAARASGR